MSEAEGDILNTYIEMGARWERQAIVAWLRERGARICEATMSDAPDMAADTWLAGFRQGRAIREQLDAERAAFQRGSEHGQRFERAAIVAWLRERHIGVGAWAAADDIERGEHLEAADE